MPPYRMAVACKVTRYNSILAKSRERPSPEQWDRLDFNNAFVDEATGGLKAHGGSAGWVLLLPHVVNHTVKGAERRAELDTAYMRWRWIVTKQPKDVQKTMKRVAKKTLEKERAYKKAWAARRREALERG